MVSNTGSLEFEASNVGGVSAEQTWEVTNNGNATTEPLAFDSTNPEEFFVTHDCGALLPGEVCTVSVRFTPNGVGVRSGQLTATVQGASASVGLLGFGLARLTAIVRALGGRGRVVTICNQLATAAGLNNLSGDGYISVWTSRWDSDRR